MDYLHYLINKINTKKIQIIIILLFTFLAYVNVFNNGYAWDDRDILINWQGGKVWESIPGFFFGDNPPGHEGNYRPLRNTLYVINYKIWGLNIFGYHLQTILIQLGATLLVYLITAKLTKNKIIPFTSGLFWGLHPIHVEAVTWITSMMDMYGIVFMFGSIYLYLKLRENTKFSGFYLIFSSLLALMAFYTNEVTLSLPFLIILIDIIFPIKENSFIKNIMTYIFYFLPLGLAMFMRLFWAQLGSRAGYLFNSFTIEFFIMLKAFLKYLQVLFVPVNLTINHHLGHQITSWAVEIEQASPETIKIINSFSLLTPEILISLLIIISLIVLAFFLRKKHPLITFGVFWFFGSSITICNLIPTEAIMVERFMYVPSFGFTLIIAYLINHLLLRRGVDSTKYKLGWTIVIVITICYFILTIIRNSEWKNDLTLFTKTLKLNPYSLVTNYILIREYTEMGNENATIKYYINLTKLTPHIAEPFTFLGDIYSSLEDYEQALPYYKEALNIRPLDLNIITKIGNLYKNSNQYDQALSLYQKAATVNKDNKFLYNNLGVIYGHLGKYSQAIEAFNRALKIDPKYDQAKENLIQAKKDFSN